jgi:hypothetical protein
LAWIRPNPGRENDQCKEREFVVTWVENVRKIPNLYEYWQPLMPPHERSVYDCICAGNCSGHPAGTCRK